jgi:hypothetical protein
MDQSSPLWRRHGWQLLAVSATCGTIVLLAALLLPLVGVVAVVGLLVSILVGMTFVRNNSVETEPKLPSDLESTLLIARDEELFDRYRRTTSLLLKVSQHQDPIYRAIALEQVDDLIRRLTSIAAGSLIFEGTETWRIVYERLLRSPGLYLYRSVSWVKNANYWQDEPGRKSMQVNFELHEQEALNIERIAIVADELWPVAEKWPVEPIRHWLHEQHVRGIWMKMVRESALHKVPDLIADMGIYGSRALGIQELDEQCRTVRFVLTFDFAKVVEAEARWNRLLVYAKSYSEHLDQHDRLG